MVPLRFRYGRSWFSRVIWVLFIVCLFVVLNGIGILSRLPEISTNEFPAKVVGNPPSFIWNNLNSSEWIHNNKQISGNGSEIDAWQRANPSSKEYQLLVYSAYWDNRTNPACVRVIGTTLTKRSPPVVCRLHFADGKSADIKAQKKPINEHFNLKYAGFLFSCCSKSFGSLIPVSVSIFEESLSNVYANLQIRNREKKESGYGGQLALCVKPFHYNFNRAVWLLEFLEFYRMMGVEKFLFYNESVGNDVQKLLEYYKSQNLARILPWEMQVENQKEIRTENMFSALNDCVYRLMYEYKYVVIVDIDEFIVPRQHNNLVDLLAEASKDEKKPCTPSYVFQNVFFYLYWENDTKTLKDEPEAFPNYVPYLLTQYKTRRLKEPHKHGKRSKFIARPEMILEAGNHITWRHIGTCKPAKLPSTMALVQHYRICEYGGFECLKLPSIEDRTAQNFGVELLDRVMTACRNIFVDLEGRCPRSPPLGSPW